MISKAEAKSMVHKLAADSLRRNGAGKLFKGNDLRDGDIKKLNAAMEELAVFLEKRGKLVKTNVGGESGSEEAEVPTVREPQA